MINVGLVWEEWSEKIPVTSSLSEKPRAAVVCYLSLLLPQQAQSMRMFLYSLFNVISFFFSAAEKNKNRFMNKKLITLLSSHQRRREQRLGWLGRRAMDLEGTLPDIDRLREPLTSARAGLE